MLTKGAKIILSHPTGNANVRALAEGIMEKELLEKFYTCVALFSASPFYSLSTLGPLKEFQKREFVDGLRPYTKVRPLRELSRLFVQRLGQSKFSAFSVDKVYQDLDLHVSRKIKGTEGVYAYEDGALQSFKQAKLLNIPCLYDLPIGYWRAMHKILDKERDEKPEWAETLPNFKDSRKKLARKDMELVMADHIFVASSFTAKTLQQFPDSLAPISIIPYGFPNVDQSRHYASTHKRKLRILFVGGLSQRKGIAQLFEAVRKLKDKVELTVVGKKTTNNCTILNDNLKNHTWIPDLPHHRILELMKTQDLFVFPSLFEGFGLVITEAMSQGTPVITTERTCGPDLIDHGVNGWLVEAGSTEALVRQLEDILARPEKIKSVGKAAMKKANERPWEVYANEMAEAIGKIVTKENKYFESIGS